jgi:protein-S-isoprenylcysteine O-methyltransferase Ste14
MHIATAIIALWIGFAISWLIAAIWSKPVEKRVGLRGEVAYRLVLIVGGVLLAVPAHGYAGPLRFWLVTRTEGWIGTALIACGFGVAWWARVHLGALWSGQITTKADHRVVDTGPYRIVRHPIYTGVLLSVYATAFVKGTLFGLTGALVITLGLWMKARIEERWLAVELDPGAYERYRQRVPMLLPWWPQARSD